MMFTNRNADQITAQLWGVLIEKTFQLDLFKQWPGHLEWYEEKSIPSCRLSCDVRRHPVACTPFEATDEVRWLRVSLSTGISLMVPTTMPTQSGQAHPSLVIIGQARVAISYYGLTGRFFHYSFTFDQPKEIPHLPGIEELPTVDLPEHLAALSRHQR